MKTSEQILEAAWKEYKPSLIVCSYSGGYDSMVATHRTLQWSKAYAHSTDIAVIAVDTKIHADGWPEYVRSSAAKIGARRFELWSTTMLDKWQEDVRERGFAYRKAQHKFYFYWLKQNAFRAIVAKYKKHINDRVMFVTGVRRSESKERANTPEHSRNGSSVWANPLVYWQEYDIHQYRINHNMPENPFYSITNNSGDCLCNWHTEISLSALKGEAREVIEPLDILCREKFGYGYGEEPSKYKAQELAGQQTLIGFEDTPYLCVGCERKQASNELRENMLMQRLEW